MCTANTANCHLNASGDSNGVQSATGGRLQHKLGMHSWGMNTADKANYDLKPTEDLKGLHGTGDGSGCCSGRLQDKLGMHTSDEANFCCCGRLQDKLGMDTSDEANFLLLEKWGMKKG